MSPAHNSNKDIDLAQQLKRIEKLPVQREFKTVLMLAEILTGFLEDISETIAEHMLDVLLDNAQAEELAMLFESWADDSLDLPECRPEFWQTDDE